VSYQMLKRFFCCGFASGMRFRTPASGYDSRNDDTSLTGENQSAPCHVRAWNAKGKRRYEMEEGNGW
jgi:hypothetical protein